MGRRQFVDLSSRTCSGNRVATKPQKRVQSLRSWVDVHWPIFAAQVRHLFKTAIVSVLSCQLPISISLTEWKKMEVKFNRSCSGAVFLYSQGQRTPVSADGWMVDNGDRLCRNLQCDNFVSLTKRSSSASVLNSGISCPSVNGTRSIWECEIKKVSAVTQQLVVECEGKM